jgi:hypothetical protein
MSNETEQDAVFSWLLDIEASCIDKGFFSGVAFASVLLEAKNRSRAALTSAVPDPGIFSAPSTKDIDITASEGGLVCPGSV